MINISRSCSYGVVVLFFTIVCALPYTSVYGAEGINAQIPFTGVLKDPDGAVLTGNYDMVFALYDVPEGGEPLWIGDYTEENAVPVDNGSFHVMLGSGDGNALTETFTDDTYYLGLTIGEDSEMLPRERIGAAAYAFNADRVDGYSANDFLFAGLPIMLEQSTTTALLTLTQLGSGNLLTMTDGSRELFGVHPDGNVGIGDTDPVSKLTVSGEVRADNFWSTSLTLNTFSGALEVLSTDPSRFDGGIHTAEGTGVYLGAVHGGVRLFQDLSFMSGNDVYLAPYGNAAGTDYVYLNTPKAIVISANAESDGGGLFEPYFSIETNGSAHILNHNQGFAEDRYFEVDFTSGMRVPQGNIILGTGFVGIGTDVPEEALHVIGSIQSSNLIGAASLSVDANGKITPEFSDAQLKTNVRTIDQALETVLALRGVRYEWKDTDQFGSSTEVGFIAQELQNVLPEVVRDNGEYLSVNSRNIVAVVVEAIKELHGDFEEYMNRTESLEREVADLRREIELLKTDRTEGHRMPSISDTVTEVIPNASSTETVLDGEGRGLDDSDLRDVTVVPEVHDDIVTEEIVEEVVVDGTLPEGGV